ncbi:MAG: hypothetical protein KGJ63_13600 [Pseudomonadota bacterium]|nr:hypothetical protein [Pseudomonadota bacterium]
MNGNILAHRLDVCGYGIEGFSPASKEMPRRESGLAGSRPDSGRPDCRGHAATAAMPG